MLVILHSGQTGVERGAHRAAAVSGLVIAGFMPMDSRDELGPVPADIAAHLTPNVERGPRAALRANLGIASGLLLAVPDRKLTAKYPPAGAVLSAARANGVSALVVDPTCNLDEVARWVRELPETSGSVRLLVSGPRQTRWAEGERFGMELVVHLG